MGDRRRRVVYVLGLGGNLGRRAANLARARRLLEKGGVAVVRASPVYETEPVGFAGQSAFLNQVLEVRSELDPPALLRLAKSVETALKRTPAVTNGPRTIDIDILLAGDHVEAGPDLVVPHPRMHLRNFVLVPLDDIAPDLRHPVLGRTVRELKEACPDRSRVERFAGRRRRRP
ncbi:MAG: 2-amino-4-hydroxy-6-hydroxymethyldihydropteridine diphosphokinase [Candidatus Aminicenantes bacterium]|nr:2-amino-4-hydroxy-6-hydroxymethyldihydropteridine diphosphokinase [Candidatus Aminicenantes bacterium]